MAGYRDSIDAPLRVLFCIGVTHSFFEESPSTLPERITAIKAAFSELHSRFGITVLGTMDDDELMVGASSVFPWTAYILAEAPDLAAVVAICNLVRESQIGEDRLWKYVRIEARIGRELFFGNE